VNAFNVPIQAYRNRCWDQSFALFNTDGTPLDCSGDRLALVVLPNPPVSGSVPVVENSTPTVEVNTVAFQIPGEEMGLLVAGKPYNWQLLRQPGSGPCSAVMVAGLLEVLDSPPFPGG
jgi:hypothetical protein